MSAITYKSPKFTVNYYANAAVTTTTEGLKCERSGIVTNNSGPIKMKFKFDWSELMAEGVDGLAGHIIVTSLHNYFHSSKLEVDLIENNQVVEMTVPTGHQNNFCNCHFEYTLTPSYNQIEKVSYDEMFASSDKNDAILIVGGKKCHVNKAFLSHHSDYFTALFSSNFKEGQMDEITLEDVSYEDFGLLLSSFHPKPVFPNDKDVEKLLEMARRFLMPWVTGVVEYHLLHNSRIGNEKMMWMADEYGMGKLLQKTIRQMNTVEKAKALKTSSEYQKLSDGMKAKVLDKVMELI